MLERERKRTMMYSGLGRVEEGEKGGRGDVKMLAVDTQTKESPTMREGQSIVVGSVLNQLGCKRKG